MQIPPKLRTKYGEGVGVEILVTHPDATDNNKTFLSSDASASAGSLSVDNGTKFSTNEYALVGAFGSEKSEIIQIGGTATGSLTVSGATSFAHNRGTMVTFLPYNQIVIERSTDGGSSYSTLATISIRADSSDTYYADTTGTSTYYYRVRFKNSNDTSYSQYSDGIIATGFAENAVGAIFREALITGNEKIDQIVTKEFLYAALHEGRTELDNDPEAGKWSFRTSFDYDAGDVVPGQYRVAVPSNLRRPDTYENILSVRIGKDGLPVDPVDKKVLNNWYRGVARSTLDGAIITTDTSIVLTSSGDFDESGSVDIAGESVGDTIDNVTYTSNTESTNTLGGTDDIDSNHSDDAIVWQGASFGYPREYAVVDGYIVFSQPFDDSLDGENIYLDYYKKLTRVDSDADTLDETDFEMYVPYLRFRMKLKRNPKMDIEKDPDFIMWNRRKSGMVAKEFLGQDIRLEVDVPV